MKISFNKLKSHHVRSSIWILIWFIPVCCYGLFKQHAFYVPKMIRPLHHTSGFFQNNPKPLKFYYIQVLNPENETWETIDEYQFFDRMPFGNRTYFQRLMHASRSINGRLLRLELKHWLLEQMKRSSNRQYRSVRFLAGTLDPAVKRTYRGKWHPAGISEIHASNIEIIDLGESE